MNRIGALAILVLAACSTSETAPLGDGLHRIDVDAGMIANPAHFDQFVAIEGDKVCPKGFIRISEKPIAGKSGYGGRTYIIRCMN